MSNRIFDFHYHLLFKHQVTDQKNISIPVETKGITSLFDDLMGGAFSSQSSPSQVGQSNLHMGVIALISVEYAFANRIFHVLGIDLSKKLLGILDEDLFNRVREGKTTYFNEFNKQVDQYLDPTEKEKIRACANIQYLYRSDFPRDIYDDKEKIRAKLEADGTARYMAFSIEGGHNLSNTPVHQGITSTNPELQLKQIQDENRLDFMFMNLCHLSEIPEQSLGGFAQGANNFSQIAFSSEDFMPKTGLGITEPGKRVIIQALTHKERPLLIDVKHMSLYTRLQYYRLKEKLAIDHPDTARLPIVSSHSGFTFIPVADYVGEKGFRSRTYQDSKTAQTICEVQPLNRNIGTTNDKRNNDLWCNPWTINLFDDEIATIMESRGMIGISLDQRILGAAKMIKDGKRKQYFEEENVPEQEWKKLFRDGQLPGAEGLLDIFGYPSRPERHIMLFCLHIIHAVKVGYTHLAWVGDASPWDHICIGSDFDGLINPINGMDNIVRLNSLGDELLKYLPIADSYYGLNNKTSALPKTKDGPIDIPALQTCIDKFLYKNGQDFMIRFLSNWYL